MAIKFLNTVAVDTNVLYVNAATNKVGIGTTSPNQPLHVAGRAIVEDRLAIGGNFTPQKALHLKNAAPVFRFEDSDITGGYLDMIKTSRNMRFDLEQNDATSATNFNFRIGGTSQLYMRDQKVGIGTESPNTQLEVDGAISTTTSDYVQGTTGSRLLLETSGSGNTHSYIQAQSSGGTSNAEDLALQLYGGNVGIGTSSPNAKLEVALGTSSGSDGIFVKGIFAGGTAYTASKNPFISLGTSYSAGYTSTIYLGASSSATNQDSKIEWSKTNNALSIYHKGQGTYREHVRFGDPSSSIAKSVFFGNVGIGTTSPSARLDVSNAGLAAKFVSTQNTGLSVQGGANSQDLAIFKNPGGITELVVKSTGNVGIGNNFNTPSERLEVSGGNLKVSNTGTTTLILNSTNSTGAKIQALKNGSASPPMGELSWNSNTGISLFFFSTSYQTSSLRLDGSNFIVTNAGSERMRINSSGNVGIGTTSPGAKLEVAGDALINDLTVGQGSGTSALGNTVFGKTALNNITTGLRNVAIGNEALLDNTTGNYNVAIGYQSLENNSANNNVAIGVQALERVETAGNNTAVGYLALGLTSGANNTAIGYGAGYLRVGGTNGNSIDSVFIGSLTKSNGLNSENEIVIGTGAESAGSNTVVLGNDDIVSTRLKGDVIVANGNVGIGTTSPSEKLEVDGEVLSDGYRVSAMQTAPAARNSTGTLGEIRITSNYIYVCYATNSWSRVALATSW